MSKLVEAIRLGVSTPSLFFRKVSQMYNQKITDSDYNPHGEDIFKKDWDNLIILDACRYDLFKDLNYLEGELGKFTSRGSATPEFLKGNFDNKSLLDTVYVTTNPMLYRHQDEIDVEFHDVINLWTGESWNDELGTVLPETTTNESIKAAEKYPNKRLIIHYMQPHYPFIHSETTFDKGHIGSDEPEDLTTWMQVMTGEIDLTRDQLWDAYSQNLETALPEVEKLVENLVGRTIVTSDHGNMFGERSKPIPTREWGHPPHIWTPELVEVPWLVLNTKGERKEVVSEKNTTDRTSEQQNIVNDRLASLGYVE
ncbi:hypothetical protein C5B91_09015 [Haloferax sp. Atlit-10N]|uniref:hypothetical protein n=1 Tax=unclassified Haloferax TaxID=2625095 RepID=UPI000E238E98|nr:MULTISPECIES: hypothetical protein [unclassified Haloferax]RDZ44872.1 hypothetical protein C5B87_11955 [Haloferax sp. Atlit-16N]RDZ59350.1 hypothetical protein C5B91_09015 [Haloferax sp. Atlit-10N]